MNERIKEMAEQAGLKFSKDWGECYTGNAQIERFAELVRADERKQAALDKMSDNARQLELSYEPVAWMYNLNGDIQINFLTPEHYGDHWSKTALYTAPPRRQWVGLTDEERRLIRSEFHGSLDTNAYSRAIEAKLKERNT